MRNFILLVFMLFGYTQLFGQENRKEIYIGFRVGNSTLDTSYGNNAVQLSEALSYLKSVKNDTTLNLKEISFCGVASPEGSFAVNRKLAEKRRTVLEQYIRENISIPDSVITRCDEVIAWEQLAKLTEQSDMPHKEEAVNVLRNVPEYTYNQKGALIDSRKKHLMELQYGRTWHYMLKHFFAQIRNASVVYITVEQKPMVEVKLQPQPVVSADTVSTRQETETQTCETVKNIRIYKPKPWYIKSNLLYDAVLMPSLEVEYRFNEHWSAAIEGNMAWWHNSHKNKYYQLATIVPEVRWWFRPQSDRKGHYLGLFGGPGWYDLENGGTGYRGEGGMVGLSYGYMFPVGKHFAFEAGIGVGYAHLNYEEYVPLDGHYVYQQTNHNNYFGPLKLKFAFVWNIGHLTKKGGNK